MNTLAQPCIGIKRPMGEERWWWSITWWGGRGSSGVYNQQAPCSQEKGMLLLVVRHQWVGREGIVWSHPCEPHQPCGVHDSKQHAQRRRGGCHGKSVLCCYIPGMSCVFTTVAVAMVATSTLRLGFSTYPCLTVWEAPITGTLHNGRPGASGSHKRSSVVSHHW